MEDSESTPASVNSNAMLPPQHPPLPRPPASHSHDNPQVSSVGQAPSGPSPPVNNSEAATATAPVAAPAPAAKKRKTTSWVWEHLIKEDHPSIWAHCKNCKTKLKADTTKNRTSSLATHLKMCMKDKSGYSTLTFEPCRLEDDEKLVVVSFSQEACRKTLVIFIIVDEQYFRMVEGEEFRELCRVLESRFKVPSRSTIRRDVMDLFEYEKNKLNNYFKVNKVRVCLTIDT